MQAHNLACFCELIQEKLPRCKFKNVITTVKETLIHASYKKIDKHGERRVKVLKGILYRIETLFREIEELVEANPLPKFIYWLMCEIDDEKEGEYSKSIGKSLTNSIASEMKLIMNKLEPYSKNEKFEITTMEIMVGREFHAQKELLIELLLDYDSDPRITIIGKPGTGKSTLIWDALLDSRVQKRFKQIFTGKFRHNQIEFGRDEYCLSLVDDETDVNEIKFLLSLTRETFRELNMLSYHDRGSKFVVISSLEQIGASSLSLPSLGEYESWELFRKIAFVDRERRQSTLLAIARKICQKCQKNSSVIHIVASILSSKSKRKDWEYFLNVVLTSVPDPFTTISTFIEFMKMPHKDRRYWGHCFAWCSLLPKDYEFQKDHLFHLWKAQETFYEDNGQDTRTPREKLDDCVDEFLSKGYFLKGNTSGSIIRYKINNLAFELMKYAAGDDFCLVDKTTPEPNHKIIRHASFIVDPSWQPPSWLPRAKQLQSLLLWPRNSGEFISLSKIGTILMRMTHLRTLHAEAIHCERLPDFLVNFKKLEYLRFGAVSSISLPQDIPALQKLLKYDFRYNDTENIALYAGDRLFDGNLEQEEELVVHVRFAGMQYQACYDPNSSKQKTNKKTGFLKFRLTSFNRDDEKLTSLNPPQTLERQNVCQWKGENLPAWPIDNLSFFPNSLLSIQILNFSGCKHLPGFHTLPHLNSLELGGMCSLVDITVSWKDGKTSKKTFYPSLKCLLLCDLPEFKGWLITEEDSNQHIQERYSFPLLIKIRVQGCPKLFSMPSVPMLESVEAVSVHAKVLNRLLCPSIIVPSLSENIQDLKKPSRVDLPLLKILEINGFKEFEWRDTSDVEKGIWHALRCLRSLKLANTPELVSLPQDLKCIMMIEKLSLCWLTSLKVLPEWIGQFTQLRKFTIHYCPKLTRLPNSDGSFSALEQLEIRCCPRVSQFPKSLLNLKRLQVQEFGRLKEILCVSPNLEDLEINNCDQLEWETPSVEGDASVNVWESLNSLQSLKLTKMDTFPKGLDFAKLSKLSRLVIEKCPKLTSLPDSLCSLSTLEHLRIYYYPGLINLPGNIKKLGSLKKLEIRVSPQLEKRCKQDGEDWPLIQHIPDIVINDSPQQSVSLVATWSAD